MVKHILDESFSLNHRQWLLSNSRLTSEELVEIAMCNKFPSISIKAFSMMPDEALKASTLINMFSSGRKENMAIITHASIKGISSKKLLWDLYMHQSTPGYAKQYIEDLINGSGTSALPITSLIRLGKPKDKFSEGQ
jgi:hypothetical protein